MMKSTRRKFFQTMGAGTAGLTLGSTTLSMASCASPDPDTSDNGQVLLIGKPGKQ